MTGSTLFALGLVSALIDGRVTTTAANADHSVEFLASSPILVAIIALGGVAISSYVAWLTATRTVLADRIKRQSDLTLKLADLIASDNPDIRLSAYRRFAIGIIKVIEPEDHDAAGLVYFMPMNTRVTVGRHEDNDIVLEGAHIAVSRWHCGFIASDCQVWVDDYLSTNGTIVNEQIVEGPTQLRDGDVIEITPFKLKYRAIKGNPFLSR